MYNNSADTYLLVEVKLEDSLWSLSFPFLMLINLDALTNGIVAHFSKTIGNIPGLCIKVWLKFNIYSFY